MASSQTVDQSEYHHSARRQFKWQNVLFIVAASLGSCMYGYSASVISTTLIQPSFVKAMGLDTAPDASDLIGLTGSMYQVGGFLGTFAVSPISDRWGRKVGIAVPAVFACVTSALLAGSVNIHMFIAFRFFAGMAAYIIVSTVPVWMSEVAPPSVRGVLVDIHGISLLFGYALASWIGYGFWKGGDSNGWRGLQALNALPGVLLLCFLPWLPESPRWLLMKDRYEDAATVLKSLHTEEEAAVELSQISTQVRIDRTLDSSYWALIKKPSYRKRAIMSFLIPAGIQLSGPLVLNNYGPTLYGALGYDTEQQFLYQIGWYTVAIGGGILALFVVERVARPKLIAFGIQFCLCCLAIEAALVATYTTPEALANPNNSALSAAVAMLFVYVVMWEICLDGTQFVYISEICPNHLRAKGIALGMAGLCAMNIMWLQVAPIAFKNIGWKFYLCFIIPGTVFVCFLLYWFPDTRRIPLEEVAKIFGDQDEIASALELEKSSESAVEKVDTEKASLEATKEAGTKAPMVLSHVESV
ncbi:MFS sugar transporter [Fonsecaea pedrosoi]|nr:MFS sugar transporter [Fonsecaea pedrosoi]